MLFLGIISWKGVSCFNGGWGCFPDGGASFLSGEDISLDGGLKKNHKDGGALPLCPPPPTMGNAERHDRKIQPFLLEQSGD